MITSEILRKKRLGEVLTKDEIYYLINGSVQKKLSPAQITAFLTSSCINGLNESETAYLTDAMTRSGKLLDFKKYKQPIADKHSTGGIGDKTSIILAPLLASCGIIVPMISGRALGHTGGTLDKMESIINLKLQFSDESLDKIIADANCFIVEQTEDIAPADKILYALRDETGNVDNDSLIVSSILSKKLAEGLELLVLDLKVGSGAFFPNIDAGKKFGELFLRTAEKLGLKCSIVFSNMNQPLGYAIGNWSEIAECESVLQGEEIKDLNELTLNLAGLILYRAGLANSANDGIILAKQKLKDKSALNYFYKMIKSQNGDLEKSKEFYSSLQKIPIYANKSGYVQAFSAKEIGLAFNKLKFDKNNNKIDFSASIYSPRKIGDYVNKGDVLFELSAKNNDNFADIADDLINCVSISEAIAGEQKIIYEIWN